VTLLVCALTTNSAKPTPAYAQQVLGKTAWNPWFGNHQNDTFWGFGEVRGTPASLKIEVDFEKEFLWWRMSVDTQTEFSPAGSEYWYYDTRDNMFIAKYGSGKYRMTQTLYVWYEGKWNKLAEHSSDTYIHTHVKLGTGPPRTVGLPPRFSS
jgi:hypothetical protein